MPAFRGYVFVRVVDASESWAGLDAIKHVTGILGTTERPLPVSDKIVNHLRKMVDDGALDDTVRGHRLRKGDKVVVRDGPFAWFEGAVDGYAGSLGIRVLVSLFGRQVPVTLELAQISKSD